MERIWHAAPAAAVHVWTDAQGVHAEPNLVAADWGAAHGIADAAGWQALVAGDGASVPVGGQTVGLRRVALAAGGALVWLLLPPPEDLQRDAAQRARAFLDRALSLADVTVWRYDLRTRRVHFNAIGFRALGLPQDATGVALPDLLAGTHPDDRTALLRANRLALTRATVVDAVARVRSGSGTGSATGSDGPWRTLLTRRVADHAADGTLSGLAGVTLDLTGQLAERARAATLDAHTRLVAEAVGIGFWSRDIDAGAVFWDAQTCRIHGLPPGSAAPGFEDWIAGYIHQSDRARVRRTLLDADTAWPPMLDFVFRTNDDAAARPRWIQSWSRRTVRDGRRVLVGMHLDISERQRESVRVEHERERAQYAIEAAEVGVWERTPDGRFTYWNDAMYQLRGLDPGAAQPIAELDRGCLDAADHETFEQLVARHMASGAPLRHECRIRRPDGSVRWLLTQGRTVRDGGGAALGMAGIDLDITGRRDAEALRQAMARAEAATQEKSAFLARVSHELRTPMNAVLGFTHLIDDDRSEKPTPRQRARLQRIAEAGRQMMALVDDLLELSSLDAGAPVTAPVGTPLVDAVRQVLDTLQPLAQTEGVALRAAAGLDGGLVHADPRRLEQLLTQFVTHALRSQRRGGQVEVASERDAAGPFAWVEARGDGAGYAADEAATLFEPFLRHGAASTSGAGTGLGLALAQRLAQAMGGDILPDGGMRTLRLRLPVGHGSGGADGAGNAAAAALPARALRVLCVEDNPVNVLLVRELLALRPHVTLQVAVDGRSAVEMALADPPDVLLLDLQLPDISGIDVLQRLRGEPGFDRCACIALSADAMPEHIARARAAGFDDYWTKPIEFDRFLAGIDRLATQPR